MNLDPLIIRLKYSPTLFLVLNFTLKDNVIDSYSDNCNIVNCRSCNIKITSIQNNI